MRPVPSHIARPLMIAAIAVCGLTSIAISAGLGDLTGGAELILMLVFGVLCAVVAAKGLGSGSDKDS